MIDSHVSTIVNFIRGVVNSCCGGNMSTTKLHVCQNPSRLQNAFSGVDRVDTFGPFGHRMITLWSWSKLEHCVAACATTWHFRTSHKKPWSRIAPKKSHIAKHFSYHGFITWQRKCTRIPASKYYVRQFDTLHSLHLPREVKTRPIRRSKEYSACRKNLTSNTTLKQSILQHLRGSDDPLKR